MELRTLNNYNEEKPIDYCWHNDNATICIQQLCSQNKTATLQHGGQLMTVLHGEVTEFGRAFLKMAGHRPCFVYAWRRHWCFVELVCVYSVGICSFHT